MEHQGVPYLHCMMSKTTHTIHFLLGYDPGSASSMHPHYIVSASSSLDYIQIPPIKLNLSFAQLNNVLVSIEYPLLCKVDNMQWSCLQCFHHYIMHSTQETPVSQRKTTYEKNGFVGIIILYAFPALPCLKSASNANIMCWTNTTSLRKKYISSYNFRNYSSLKLLVALKKKTDVEQSDESH